MVVMYNLIRLVIAACFLLVQDFTFAGNNASALKVGDKAPDFSLSAPNGSHVSLSSLKGKVVLIDFWASWCGYCKIANQELIPIYENFKSEGFEILSVSVDSKKEAWVNAINMQKLPWQHVSDLKGWDCKVAEAYAVESLPSTFLIDENGVIIEVDLDEYDLEKKLNWIFYEQVNFYPHIATTKLFFTTKAKFEIFDAKGVSLLKGKESEVDITNLASGEYTLVYENKKAKFIKKNNITTPPTFYPERVDDKITLSREAEYELYNVRGKVVKKGKETVVHVQDFKTGIYYLVIEGNLHQVFKK